MPDLEEALARSARAWRLTPRQIDVLRCVLRGEANKEITERLGCAVRTVEVHVGALLEKAGASGRTELAFKVLMG